MSLLLEQILPLSSKAGKFETAAVVPEGGFCFQWYINHILARNSTTETWQWFFPSPSSNTHGLLHSVTSFWGQLLNSRWCACVQQLASFHSIPSFSHGTMCVSLCVCLCVCVDTHNFQLPFNAFSVSQPKSWEAWHTPQQWAQMSSCDTVSFPASLLEQYSFTISNKRVIWRLYFVRMVWYCSLIWEK